MVDMWTVSYTHLLRIATNEKVPAYIVFSNSTLQDMASKKPTTMTEFLDVSGVGKYKAEQYGEIDVYKRQTTSTPCSTEP